AQPPATHQGGAFRLHLPEERAHLFRLDLQADGRSALARRPGEGGIPGRRPDGGGVRPARFADEAQNLALPAAGLKLGGTLMSGFDVESLLPTYLDEVDEQISSLNETLLRLEQAPDDEKTLRDAFRLVHTVKGSSTMMGFGQVRDLTHHLETFFD